MNTRFHQFWKAASDEECLAIRQELESGGFAAFREFLDDFRDLLKRYTDRDKEQVQACLEKAKRWFPDPGAFSPAWQNVWEQYAEIIRYKNVAMEAVPEPERDGEWQIVIDNPYKHQPIVCYPGLQFIEAAYLYGYFHPDLEKNEYLRLQKIHTVLFDHGKIVKSPGRS